jgi:hypothetical protein
LPAMRFLEEVNAYLEQLNAAKCHKDPFLVAFTLTTDVLPPPPNGGVADYCLFLILLYAKGRVIKLYVMRHDVSRNS